MPPPIPLEGKPVIITGASSGIGAATAISCARAGMPVTLFARRADRLDAVAERIRTQGGTALCIAGDVADPEAPAELIAKTEEHFAPLYSVIANAGYGMECATSTMPIDQIRALFEVNFFGSLMLVQPAIERFRAHGAGHALMVSSCLSKLSMPYYACYCATKSAQDMYCRSMRLELESEGIRVSSVHPIGTKTEFFQTADENSEKGLRVSSTRNGRFMQPPERVADAIVRCLRKPKGEVWTSLPTRLALAAGIAMPGVADRLLARALRRRMGG
ncbi:MAG: SDR family NAD(P)-dependent oxidoreductase [Phycisphaerales bacterium]|nr:SDR family NAD(P)-dependent oxidoreductase [Phycisphaerales bacterium]